IGFGIGIYRISRENIQEFPGIYVFLRKSQLPCHLRGGMDHSRPCGHLWKDIGKTSSFYLPSSWSRKGVCGQFLVKSIVDIKIHSIFYSMMAFHFSLSLATALIKEQTATAV